MKAIVLLTVFLILAIGVVSAAQVCETYDDFSSGSLDLSKWEVRQDPEGQPFTDEKDVLDEGDGFVFHRKQNTTGDRRTYLVPTHILEAGESFEYEVEVVSKEGNYGSPVLLVGEEYARLHLSAAGFNGGVQNYDELGTSHVTVSFSGTNFSVIRESPSGGFFPSSTPAQEPEGDYELYFGAWSGGNGKIHADFDNFKLCGEEVEPSLEDRIEELENRVEELEDRTTLLEDFMKRVKRFIRKLPKGLKKGWKG